MSFHPHSKESESQQLFLDPLVVKARRKSTVPPQWRDRQAGRGRQAERDSYVHRSRSPGAGTWAGARPGGTCSTRNADASALVQDSLSGSPETTEEQNKGRGGNISP